MCLDVSLMDVAALILQTMANQPHCQFVLSHFAESRLCGKRDPRGGTEGSASVSLRCLCRSSNAAFHRLENRYSQNLCVEEPPFARWEAELWEVVIFQQKRCVWQCQDLIMHSVLPLGVFSLRCPPHGLEKMKSFKTWGNYTSLQVQCNLVEFK